MSIALLESKIIPEPEILQADSQACTGSLQHDYNRKDLYGMSNERYAGYRILFAIASERCRCSPHN